MFLPMMGFTVVLMIAGGLGSLVHIAATRVDPDSRGILLYSFSIFYAGLGAFAFSLGLPYLLGNVLHSQAMEGLAFLFGYFGGGLTGGLLGHRIAFRRIRRLRN